MKHLKPAIGCVLILVLFLFFTPSHAQDDVEIFQGTCGENISWIYDHYNSTLTISGTGRIPSRNEFNYNVPWDDWHKKAKILIIEPGITTIGAEAFTSGNFSKIILPETLTTIEYAAFRNCVLPDYFFLPDSVTTIENHAFYQCYFTQIRLPENLSYLGSHALARNPKLSSIILPSKLTEISDDTFWMCENLSSMYIPDSVTKIGDGAFHETGLTTLTIPDSVTLIGRMALFRCTELVDLKLGNGVSEIGDYSITDCKKLKQIHFNGTTDQWNLIKIGSNNKSIDQAEIITLSSDCVDSHQYKPATVTPPTCTEAGYTTYTCTKCGHYYRDDFVNATGHLFGNWQPYQPNDSTWHCNKGTCQHSNCGQEYLSYPYKIQVTVAPDEIIVYPTPLYYDNMFAGYDVTYTIVGGELTVFFTDAPSLTLPLNAIESINNYDPVSSQLQPIDFQYYMCFTTYRYALTVNTTNFPNPTIEPSTTEEITTIAPSTTEEITTSSSEQLSPTTTEALETTYENTTECSTPSASEVDQPTNDTLLDEFSSEESSSLIPEETTAECHSTAEYHSTAESHSTAKYTEPTPQETATSETDVTPENNKWFLFGCIFTVILGTCVGLLMTKKTNN